MNQLRVILILRESMLFQGFILCIGILSFIFPFASQAASGTIDSVYRYAWGENVGFVDFGGSADPVVVTDSALTGSAYGENIGWLVLNPVGFGGVLHDGFGGLSGYAWGENVGWVDFSRVAIGSDGLFAGQAYGENIGWIMFGTGANRVVTDWRNLAAEDFEAEEPAVSGSSSGGPSTADRVKWLRARGDFERAAQIEAGNPQLFTNEESESERYQELFAQLKEIERQLQTLFAREAEQETVVVPMNNLYLGAEGEEVLRLQRLLNIHGYTVATTGVGSLGNETRYFGPRTEAALTRFQEAAGVEPARGYFGPLTRAAMIKLGW